MLTTFFCSQGLALFYYIQCKVCNVWTKAKFFPGTCESMYLLYICNDSMLYSDRDNLQHHSVRVNYIALAEPQTGIEHIQQEFLPSLTNA